MALPLYQPPVFQLGKIPGTGRVHYHIAGMKPLAIIIHVMGIYQLPGHGAVYGAFVHLHELATYRATAPFFTRIGQRFFLRYSQRIFIAEHIKIICHFPYPS